MNDKSEVTSISFEDNFNILDKNSKEIERGTNIKIDNLLSIVQESSVAYNNCKKKLDMIKEIIEDIFTKGETSEDHS
jgi:exonuclease VII small subunit